MGKSDDQEYERIRDFCQQQRLHIAEQRQQVAEQQKTLVVRQERWAERRRAWESVQADFARVKQNLRHRLT